MPDRFDRQKRVKVIGEPGQRRIEQATVIIAGVGALGTYAAAQLIRAGVAGLILVDPDVVTLTNLQRQALFTEADVGELKVTAAKRHLLEINHSAHIQVVPESIDRSFFEDHPATLVLDCLDNYTARDTINQAALAGHFDYIFASCAGTFGSVMPVSPTHHACLNCLYPNLAELKQTDCDLIGVNTALVPLVSALQVSLALHYLVDRASVQFDRLYTFDNWTMTQQTFRVQKADQCAMCHRLTWPVPTDTSDTLQVLCGTQTYQVTHALLPSLPLIEQYLENQKVPYKRFKTFLSFNWDGYTISLFKNQKLLLYGVSDLEAATRLYQTIKTAFNQEVIQP
ncbi:HesA/MoeB/ThiF family protein [Secundilactobacillus kimchicus]|uniref:HesA/MoeB/ThiF family protein n=1 Tax=Secundilactobacillus kimchicus TaxID=528209 RepID=UPI0024A83A52|nr:HesA/MoeB/ThiF family protein [Secundilactobacillus kimchicus]